MGEVDSAPAAPAPPMPDVNALEVDPAKGEVIVPSGHVAQRHRR